MKRSNRVSLGMLVALSLLALTGCNPFGGDGGGGFERALENVQEATTCDRLDSLRVRYERRAAENPNDATVLQQAETLRRAVDARKAALRCT